MIITNSRYALVGYFITSYPTRAHGIIVKYRSPNFHNCSRYEKDLKDNKDNSLHLGRKYVRIFVLGHYLFLVAHSFARATISEKCSLSADKYPSIFSRQMTAIRCLFNVSTSLLTRNSNHVMIHLRGFNICHAQLVTSQMGETSHGLNLVQGCKH